MTEAAGAKDSAVALNKKHFDDEKHAHHYDNESSLEMGRVVVKHILAYTHPALTQPPGHNGVSIGADGEPLAAESESENENDEEDEDVNAFWKHARVLDFAAGTGLISQHLLRHIDAVVGVDISTEMIKLYNKKRDNQGVSASAMAGYVADLFEPRETWQEAVQKTLTPGFDAAVCSLAYHHIDDTDRASSVLFSVLRPGGWAFVADLAQGTLDDYGAQKPASNHSHGQGHDGGVVPHKGGFTPAELEASFTTAGFVNVSAESVFTVKLWTDDEGLKRFRGHYARADIISDTERYGVRIFDQRKDAATGVTKYLIKRKMLLAVGQKPLVESA
jgi:SAM-dependent methyltransferase